MYFDQPFQVGLSYWSKKENVDNSYDSAKYVVDALKQFFQSQPNLAKCKFYIWGESYAGHYIPVLGREIFNQGLDQLINYQGISIAGAYVAPLDQVLSASSQLFTFGVIDQFRQQQLKKITTEAIDNYNVQNNAEFLRLRDLLLFDATYIGNNYRYNIQFYDVVEDENYVNFINSHMVAFDGRRTFEPCNMDVYYAFWDDQAISVEKDILFLLDKGKVMIYNGQLDSVVNTPGALSWVNRMKWNKIDKWKQSKKQPFYFNKGLSVGGNIKQYDNFAFGVVYNAGHNTPEDQPDSNYELLKYFLSEWEKEGINM